MKFFILIINLYLLVLSCIPCGDKDDMEIASVKTTLNNQHTDHEEKETCTPFCTCAHCPASAFFEQIKNSQIILKQIFAITYPNQEVSFSHRYEFSIWQPPKIS